MKNKDSEDSLSNEGKRFLNKKERKVLEELANKDNWVPSTTGIAKKLRFPHTTVWYITNRLRDNIALSVKLKNKINDVTLLMGGKKKCWKKQKK